MSRSDQQIRALPRWLVLAQIPLHEQVLDRLADLLVDTNEVLDMLEAEEAAELRWALQPVRSVYDLVNTLMQEMTD